MFVSQQEKNEIVPEKKEVVPDKKEQIVKNFLSLSRENAEVELHDQLDLGSMADISPGSNKKANLV